MRSKPRRERITVYVCDDVPELRALLRVVVEGDGMRVVGEAGDARTMLADLPRADPDVVVLDLAMPGLDGLAAIPLVHEAEPRRPRNDRGRTRASTAHVLRPDRRGPVTSIHGERVVGAAPERVFAALTDPDVVATAIPVIRSHREVDDDHWEAKVKAPIPFAPSVTIRFIVTERRPPEHAAIQTHGGGAHVTSSFDLEPDGNGGTHVRWRAQIALSGILAPFAGHGLEPLARRAAEHVLDRVAAAAV